MRLYYHPESDALYWAEMWDGVSEDVTEEQMFRLNALGRGIKTPPEVTSIVDGTKSRNMADAIVKSYKAWDRKPADMYPTPVDATESIMPLIKALGIKRVWEPACGDGRMSRVLEWHGLEVHSTDIREFPGYGQGGFDFLNGDPLLDWGWALGEIDAVITNPPFSLAKEFIEKALTYAPIVIMLVKQNYYNTKGRIPFFDVARPSFFLPITWRLAFLKEERGNSPLMDCAWAVWTLDKDLFDATGRAIDGCLFEPVRKSVYPGYHSKGLKAAFAGLTEAFGELADALRLDGVVGSIAPARSVAEATSDDDI